MRLPDVASTLTVTPGGAQGAAAPAPPTTAFPTDLIGPGGGGSSALPGSPFLHQLAGGVATWALIAAVIGIFVGGILWAFGSYSQNYQQAYNGRKGVVVSVVAALLVGAGPYLVRFFYQAGNGINA